MVLGSTQPIKKVNIDHVRVGDAHIEPSTNVRNLGVMFDSAMKMDCQVTALSKAAFMSIRNIGRIRDHLTREAAETIVDAFITSRIDSCNSLLYGINNAHLSRLQRIQNIAARMITYTRKSDHITPVLANLHWLPIQQRVKNKLCLIIFKTLQGDAPAYLSDLVQLYAPGHRGLRSSQQKLLKENMANYRWGREAFKLLHQAFEFPTWNC
ncbi:uncharacterized protein LOC119739982 [Patiria miniata]|uniref:Uncharacterized protein n=1 Tax=Patiria miniata TaxID=46514 RepID=A0A914B567_PATMI|nr:uncharacterized protein LOC119739982 [Patiria miniata]